MILDLVRAELRDHPAKAIAAGVAAVLAPFVVRILYICWVEILVALGVPR